jgi:serine protease AprX
MTVSRLLTIALATASLGASVAAPAPAATPPQGGKVASQSLIADAAANPAATFLVIVTTKDSSQVVEKNGKLSKNGKTFGTIYKSLDIVHGNAAEVTGSTLLDLVATPGVATVTLDAPVAHDSYGAGPPQLWQTAAGLDDLPASPSAPAIAVVDSGIAKNAGMSDRILTSVNLTPTGPEGAIDDYGHGTLVAGIAAGSSAPFPGAAATARLVSIRVVGADGSARTSDVIAAADWIFQNRARYGIRVANFSLHSTAAASAVEDPLDLAVRRLWLTGTVVVTAAGNEGAGRMVHAPASDPFVITVGAVGSNDTSTPLDDTAAPWSSFGYTGDGFAKPELVAPGRMMVGPVPKNSVLAQTFPDRVVGAGWMWMSGTSFSAPVVSGIAARLLALHPTWTPDDVKGALMATATHLRGGMATGVGEVNAAAAAASVSPPNPNAPLAQFVSAGPDGVGTFDGDAWRAAATDASWASASWASASWASASWASASWTSASWASASWASASWASGALSDASWASASWASASWASASWASTTSQP